MSCLCVNPRREILNRSNHSSAEMGSRWRRPWKNQSAHISTLENFDNRRPIHISKLILQIKHFLSQFPKQECNIPNINN